MTIYGIDLGTTYTKVAYFDDRHEQRVLTVPMGVGHLLDGCERPGLRSAVALWTGPGTRPMACVGEQARRTSAFDGLVLIEESKSRIGLAEVNAQTDLPEARWSVPGQSFVYRPEDVAALILRRAKAIVDQQVPDHPMQDVVITFPQRFEGVRREATRTAGELAGLHVLETLTEPDAVGWLFGVENNEPGISMIFDIGGGTTDINVVRYSEGNMEVLGSAGVHVAGRHFDDALLRRVIIPACHAATDGRFTEELLRTRPREYARFMAIAEEFKIRLSGAAANDAYVQIRVDSDIVPTASFDIHIRRSRAEVGEAVNAEVDTCRRAAYDALAAAQSKAPGLEFDSLKTVFLVGGSSGLVWIRDMLERLTGSAPRIAPNPSSAIAEGAAYFAHRLSRRTRPKVEHATDTRSAVARRKPTMLNLLEGEVRTTLQRGLGLVAYNAAADTWYVENLVRANTNLPTTYERRVATASTGEDEIFLEFMEGDSSSIEACTSAAECVIPIPKFGAGEQLVIRIHVDHAGRKRISVEHTPTGREYPAILSFPEEAVVPVADVPSRREYIASVMLTDRLPTG